MPADGICDFAWRFKGLMGLGLRNWGLGPVWVAYVFVFLSSVIIRRLYKLTL